MSVQQVEGPRVVMTNTKASTSCEVFLHGAHITKFDVAGKPVIFTSNKAIFDNVKPIRGGIPLCWPQFGPGELPQHGFARNTPWKLVNQSIANDVSATFEMATLPAWKNNNYALQLTVTLTSDQRLRTTFVVANKHATESFACQFAFHSYFYLQNDISQMKIEGLQGTTYVDKMQKAQEFPESNSLLGITAETDRVYKAAPNTLYIHDGTDRTIVLSKTIEDAVVWNPWVERSKAIADLGDEEYHHFVCVESGQISNLATVPANGTWTCSQDVYIK